MMVRSRGLVLVGNLRKRRRRLRKVCLRRFGGLVSVWSRGIGVNGALGLGDTRNVPIGGVPERVDAVEVNDESSPVVQICAGLGHSAFRDASGRVFVCGRTHDVQVSARFGRLAETSPAALAVMNLMGLQASIDALKPTELTSFHINQPTYPEQGFCVEGIRDMTCGACTTAFISKESDILFMFGANGFGQCAQVSKDAYVWTPTTVSGLPAYDLKMNMIALGFRHAVALTKKGVVYTWGKGNRGQLGNVVKDGTFERFQVQQDVNLPGKALKVTAGNSCAAALLEDGRVFVWGRMQGDSLDTLKRKKVFRDQPRPREVIFQGNSPIIGLWASSNHHIALSADGRIHQWGLMPDGVGENIQAIADHKERHEIKGMFGFRSATGASRTLPNPVSFEGPPALRDGAKALRLEAGDRRAYLFLEGHETPFVWDWSLKPLPIEVFEPSLVDFVSARKIKQVSCGWQHELFLCEEK